MNNYHFSHDHFTKNVPHLQSVVLPKLKKETINILDISPVEGRSTVWFLENIPNSTVTVVQTDKNAKTIRNMEHNLGYFKKRVNILYGDVPSCMTKLKDETFDFIYIDIGKDSRFTLETAVLSFLHLNPRGFMVFDDYTSDKTHAPICPKQGIDAFVGVYARYIKVVYSSWQLVLMKRSKPLPQSQCMSEYYHENLNTI